MKLRTFYLTAVLLPLVGLAVAALLDRGTAGLTVGLGPGGSARWLYPTSAARGLLAYILVAGWLLLVLFRRSPAALGSLLWWAPLAYVAAHILVLAPLVLVQGRAGEFLAEQGGRAAIRLAAHLVFSLAYVALVVFSRERLRSSGALETAEPTPP